MFGLLRQFCLTLVILTLGSPVISAGGNYLCFVGPTQLRFQKVVEPLDPAVVLPPLRMNDEPVATNATTSISIEIEEEPEAQPPLDHSGEQLPLILESEAAPENSIESTSSADGSVQLSPQILFHKYFQHTDRKSVLVPAHWEFKPPSPPSTPGSSATYHSPR